MASVEQLVRDGYRAYIRCLSYVQPMFLLVLRLYFGYGFMKAGLGKLQNPEAAAAYFADLHIPLPGLNAYLAGTTECVGGLLLLLGLASRVATIPLIGTMLVAYLTAHTEQFYAFWGNTPLFFKAPPFPYLFTCLVVLLVGPGLLSLDGLIKWWFDRKRAGAGVTGGPGSEDRGTGAGRVSAANPPAARADPR